MTCARSWELRAIDEGRLAVADVAAFERHARSCATCHAELAARAELRDLAAQVEPRAPTELDLRRLRGRVLRDAMSPPSSRAPRFALAAVVLAAAAALVFKGATHSRPLPAVAFAAVIVPKPSAQWTQTRENGTERVVLADGDVELHVRKQEAGERFLVVVPDGEVEVRGTTFEVSVHAGQTTRVHVDDGVVTVRVHSDTTLAAGESWPTSPPEREQPSATPSPVPPASPHVTAASTAPHVAAAASHQSRPAPAREPHAPPSPPAISNDHEMADYERAIQAYRLGHYEEAADLLHEFTLAHPSSSFLDDASFMEASSLASAGRADAAALLAERLLQRFPQSFHRKEAAILIARQRRNRGDCRGARELLAAWSDDADIEAALGTCAPHTTSP